MITPLTTMRPLLVGEILLASLSSYENLEPHSSILSDHFSDHTEQKHVVSGTAALSKLQAVNDV